MSNKLIYIYDGGRQKAMPSQTNAINFLSVAIGSSALAISEDTGAFNFNSNNFVNVGTVNGVNIGTVSGRQNALISLSGVAESGTHLGSFTGSIIPDDQTIKAAIQAIETSLEGISTDASGVTYTPSVLTDWDTSTDPGNTNNALDQTVSRVKVVEGVASTNASSISSNGTAIGTNVTNIANAQDEIDKVEVTLGAIIDANGDYVAHSGKNYINANADVTEDLIDLDTQIKSNADAISLITGSGMDLKGGVDASAISTQLDDVQKGWFFVVTVAGTLFATNPISLNIGDNLFCSIDVVGTPVDGASFVKIDNTESPDILRNTHLASGEIFLGNGSGLTSSVSMSGDATMDNTGAVSIGTDKVVADMLNADIFGEGVRQNSTTSAIEADHSKAILNDNASTITARQIVYIKSNGSVDLAKADTELTIIGKLGIVEDLSIAAASIGNIITKSAYVGGFTGLTAGGAIYASEAVAGGITQTIPTSGFIAPIGKAISATIIEFKPEPILELL